MNLIFFSHHFKKILIVGSILLILIFVLMFMTLSGDSKFPGQKTLIGETTNQEIEKTLPIDSIENFDGNITRYNLKSENPIRPSQIITNNNVASFERTYVLDNPNAQLTISGLKKEYGEPEEVVQGSKFYGDHMQTFLYPNRGFAFIANPNTDEVYETQIFPPTSMDIYKSNYGEDLVYEITPENL